MSNEGKWLPISEASLDKIYDLATTDGEGWIERVIDCFWRKGGRYGKAGWYHVPVPGEGAEPVVFMDKIQITHCMSVPEIPS